VGAAYPDKIWFLWTCRIRESNFLSILLSGKGIPIFRPCGLLCSLLFFFFFFLWCNQGTKQNCIVFSGA
jgi:hypothetical protein